MLRAPKPEIVSESTLIAGVCASAVTHNVKPINTAQNQRAIFVFRFRRVIICSSLLCEISTFKKKREHGTNGNNGTGGKKRKIIRLFRYFRLFRVLSSAWHI